MSRDSFSAGIWVVHKVKDRANFKKGFAEMVVDFVPGRCEFELDTLAHKAGEILLELLNLVVSIGFEHLEPRGVSDVAGAFKLEGNSSRTRSEIVRFKMRGSG